MFRLYTSQLTAFETLRKYFASDNVLTHYDPHQQIGVSGDAFAMALRPFCFTLTLMEMRAR